MDCQQHKAGDDIKALTSAAEAGSPEAMERLVAIYGKGDATRRDYGKAAVWAERLYEQRRESLGETHPDTLSSLRDLALCTHNCTHFTAAAKLYEEACRLHREAFGEDHRLTLSTLRNLIRVHRRLDNHQRARELTDLYDELWGRRHKI